MNTTILTKMKSDACKWASALIPTLPFFIAVTVDGRRQWQEEATKEIVKIPAEPGIYLIYPFGKKTPVYIGEASDLRRRLTYHFAHSASSHKESTLKKNLRKEEIWDGETPIERCFRFCYFTLCFGRKEIEECLHATYKVNTGQCKP